MLRFIVSHRLRRFTQMFMDKKIGDFQNLCVLLMQNAFNFKNT